MPIRLARCFTSVKDGSNNANDRYAFAAWANEHWFKHHYYWGFPDPAHAHSWLAGTRHKTALREFRLAEANAPGTQPTRKLAYPGSVGSQALLGMRRLHVLRNDPALASISHVWPMETGFTLPAMREGTASIVHAEIYPTPVLDLIVRGRITMPEEVAGLVNDAQQVWACASLARHEDVEGTLARRFGVPSILKADQISQARQEGWILWT